MIVSFHFFFTETHNFIFNFLTLCRASKDCMETNMAFIKCFWGVTKKDEISFPRSSPPPPPSIDVLIKRCSENMQQISRRTPMPRCDLNKVAKQLYWNRTLEWMFFCKFAAYFQSIFSKERLRSAASVFLYFNPYHTNFPHLKILHHSLNVERHRILYMLY